MRIRPSLAIAASVAVVAAGGVALGRWLDPTRRITWGGLSRQPPFAVADFALRDHEGRLVRRADRLGRVWVADFVFLQCGETCTVVSRRLRELLRRVPGDGVRFVSFSVDAGDGPDDVPAAFVASGRYLFLVDRAGVVERSYDGLDDDEVRRLDDELVALERGHE